MTCDQCGARAGFFRRLEIGKVDVFLCSDACADAVAERAGWATRRPSFPDLLELLKRHGVQCWSTLVEIGPAGER